MPLINPNGLKILMEMGLEMVGSISLRAISPAGYVSLSGDCNDGDGAVAPNATEVCNLIDDNCDGLIDDADANLDLNTATEFLVMTMSMDKETPIVLYFDALSYLVLCRMIPIAMTETVRFIWVHQSIVMVSMMTAMVWMMTMLKMPWTILKIPMVMVMVC